MLVLSGSTWLQPSQQCVKFTFAEQRNFPICQVVSTVQTVDVAAFDLLVFRCSIGTADFDGPQRSCCKPRDGDAAGDIHPFDHPPPPKITRHIP